MELRHIVPLFVLLGLLAAATSADAASRYRVGIGDQHARIVDDPRFQATGIKRLRYLVPWDWQRVEGQQLEVHGYMAAAHRTGKEVFVTFTASRGCWSNNRYSKAKRCRAPSSRAYAKSFRAFRKVYPWVKVYAPWNEANHKSQTTAKSPKRAAQYYNVLRRYCRGCTLLAADVLDQSGVERYLRSVDRYAKGTPRRWGLHNYSDVNRKRTKGTRGVLRTVRGEVWLTETGGVVEFGRSFPYSESRAAARTRYMFSLADKYSRKRRGMRSRITRVYPYAWYGEPKGARFDAGLVDPDGTPRPAYHTFLSLVKKRSK